MRTCLGAPWPGLHAKIDGAPHFGAVEGMGGVGLDAPAREQALGDAHAPDPRGEVEVHGLLVGGEDGAPLRVRDVDMHGGVAPGTQP